MRDKFCHFNPLAWHHPFPRRYPSFLSLHTKPSQHGYFFTQMLLPPDQHHLLVVLSAFFCWQLSNQTCLRTNKTCFNGKKILRLRVGAFAWTRVDLRCPLFFFSAFWTSSSKTGPSKQTTLKLNSMVGSQTNVPDIMEFYEEDHQQSIWRRF